MSAAYYPRAGSLFPSVQKPSAHEVEVYAQIIAQLEGRHIEECREQAELQLWATRPSRPRKVPIRMGAENLSPAC